MRADSTALLGAPTLKETVDNGGRRAGRPVNGGHLAEVRDDRR
jgi:hypothetical protein